MGRGALSVNHLEGAGPAAPGLAHIDGDRQV